MKKLCIVSLFYLLTLSNGFGQNQKSISKEKRTVAEENNLTAVAVSKPASESPYFGFEAKIMELSATNTIPSGFPTKDGYNNRETYRKAINKWILDNQAFVKPEFKNKIIND